MIKQYKIISHYLQMIMVGSLLNLHLLIMNMILGI
nr:MAG TPA: hypothetical protein [Caudoviricetes sp.]